MEELVLVPSSWDLEALIIHCACQLTYSRWQEEKSEEQMLLGVSTYPITLLCTPSFFFFFLLAELLIIFQKAIGPVKYTYHTICLYDQFWQRKSKYLSSDFVFCKIIGFLKNRFSWHLPFSFSLFLLSAWNRMIYWQRCSIHTVYKTDNFTLKMAEKKDIGILMPFLSCHINSEFSNFANFYMRKNKPLFG